MTTVLGAIADDFTGATDLANTLVKEGMSTVQVIGVPKGPLPLEGVEAVIVALKSRTCPVDDAVAHSRAALSWLRAQGVQQVIFKYCSTFDSTPQGNIGPVADALGADLDAEFAVICPAFPENHRTIYKGRLFVGEVLLEESSMKDHPLTPMVHSNLMALMEAQSRHRAGLISLQVVRQGYEAICARIETLVAEGYRYGVADALNDEDLRQIGAALRGHALVTGGSGIATGLPANLRAAGALGQAAAPRMPGHKGRALVIAGSCSAATRAQIARAQEIWPTMKIDIDRLADGEDEVGRVVAWARAQSQDQPVLVYGSADPQEVARNQARYGTGPAGEMIEQALSGVAAALVDGGADRLIVAGGETSGAVVTALGITGLRIGPEIAPGVPWTESLQGPSLALALKSGNFGDARFFETAFAMRE